MSVLQLYDVKEDFRFLQLWNTLQINKGYHLSVSKKECITTALI